MLMLTPHPHPAPAQIQVSLETEEVEEVEEVGVTPELHLEEVVQESSGDWQCSMPGVFP